MSFSILILFLCKLILCTICFPWEVSKWKIGNSCLWIFSQSLIRFIEGIFGQPYYSKCLNKVFIEYCYSLIESNFIQTRSKGHNYFNIPITTSSMQSLLLPFHFEWQTALRSQDWYLISTRWCRWKVQLCCQRCPPPCLKNSPQLSRSSSL